MADSWNYIGQVTRGYLNYCDTETGRMLVADPGGNYSIRPVEEGLPVPPGDGWWDTSPAPKPAAKKTAAKTAAGGE